MALGMPGPRVRKLNFPRDKQPVCHLERTVPLAEGSSRECGEATPPLRTSKPSFITQAPLRPLAETGNALRSGDLLKFLSPWRNLSVCTDINDGSGSNHDEAVAILQGRKAMRHCDQGLDPSQPLK